MKNELGIEVKCENCVYLSAFCKQSEKDCYVFSVKPSALKQRIIELQEQVKELESENNGLNEYYQQQQFTEEEAEKIETFLTHGYQMMINKNKKIFSKLEKMKGEQ